MTEDYRVPLTPLGFYRYWLESAKKTFRNRVLIILSYPGYVLSMYAMYLLNKVDG